MKYYYPITDKNGYIHSIDMLYFECFVKCGVDGVIDMCRKFHENYPTLPYMEMLDRPHHSNYDFYIHGITISGIYIATGKYTDYDRDSKTFRLLPMMTLRFNPNKYMDEDWFQELLKEIMDVNGGGVLRKYDYAIDIPVPIDSIKLFDTRKEYGLFKGTRYYGQSGRHGYLKVYDKGKDMMRKGDDVGTLTRVETTLDARKIPSLENIYILSNSELNTDYSSLKDTDKAIVEMYLTLKHMGVDYDLKLGRKKMDKLKEYITGRYTLLEYEHILDELVKHFEYIFNINDDVMIITDDDGFLQVPSDIELPFD